MGFSAKELCSGLHLLGGCEKLLHEAFLVGLEGFELLGFGGDQGVVVGASDGGTLKVRGKGLVLGVLVVWAVGIIPSPMR